MKTNVEMAEIKLARAIRVSEELDIRFEEKSYLGKMFDKETSEAKVAIANANEELLEAEYKEYVETLPAAQLPDNNDTFLSLTAMFVAGVAVRHFLGGDLDLDGDFSAPDLSESSGFTNWQAGRK